MSTLSTVVTLLAVVAPIVACSSEGGRDGFAAPAPSTTDEPEQGPAPTTTATPVTPTPRERDAGTTPPDDDCERAAPSKVCGVAPQCGCASTHTCDVVDSKGAVRCITAGNAPMGHPCTATAGCSRGLTCIFGTCHAFCESGNDASCADLGGGACAQIKMQDGSPVPNLAICRVSCELQDAESCGGKTNAGIGVCTVDGQGGTDCRKGGPRALKETCSEPEDCGPGLVCATANSVSSCKRWCRVGQNDCGAGKTCTGLKTEVKIGDVEYGTCP